MRLCVLLVETTRRSSCRSSSELNSMWWDLTPSDGLHLTSAGYKVLFDDLTALVTRTWPELEPETILMRLPQ